MYVRRTAETAPQALPYEQGVDFTDDLQVSDHNGGVDASYGNMPLWHLE
jgi:hypothetical protein